MSASTSLIRVTDSIWLKVEEDGWDSLKAQLVCSVHSGGMCEDIQTHIMDMSVPARLDELEGHAASLGLRFCILTFPLFTAEDNKAFYVSVEIQAPRNAKGATRVMLMVPSNPLGEHLPGTIAIADHSLYMLCNATPATSMRTIVDGIRSWLATQLAIVAPKAAELTASGELCMHPSHRAKYQIVTHDDIISMIFTENCLQCQRIEEALAEDVTRI